MSPCERVIAAALTTLAATSGGFGLLVAVIILWVAITASRRRATAEAARRADLNSRMALLTTFVLSDQQDRTPTASHAVLAAVETPAAHRDHHGRRLGTPTQEMPLWQRRKIAATARNRPPDTTAPLAPAWPVAEPSAPTIMVPILSRHGDSSTDEHARSVTPSATLSAGDGDHSDDIYLSLPLTVPIAVVPRDA